MIKNDVIQGVGSVGKNDVTVANITSVITNKKVIKTEELAKEY